MPAHARHLQTLLLFAVTHFGVEGRGKENLTDLDFREKKDCQVWIFSRWKFSGPVIRYEFSDCICGGGKTFNAKGAKERSAKVAEK
jgi:hypothetical protein